MMQMLSSVRRNRIFKRVTVIAGGTALAQAVAVLASPVLTRLYSPEAFGVLALFIGIVQVGGVVSALRYELAIPMAGTEDDAASVVVVAALANAISAVAVLLVIAAAGEAVATALNAEALIPYLVLVPIALLGSGLYRILTYWALVRKEDARVRATILQRTAAQLGVQIGMGAIAKSPLGLLLGQVVGFFGGVAALAARTGIARGVSKITAHAVLRSAARFRKFALVSTPSALINSLGVNLPVILLTALYGASVVGWYSLAARIMAIPSLMVGQAVGQVYLTELAEALRSGQGTARRMYFHTVGVLLAVGSVVVLGLAALGPVVFPVVFGREWAVSGDYIRLLAPFVLGQFVAVPVSQTLNVTERQELQLSWDVLRLVVLLATFYAVRLVSSDARAAVAAFSIAMALMYCALLWMCYGAVTRAERSARQAAAPAHSGAFQ